MTMNRATSAPPDMMIKSDTFGASVRMDSPSEMVRSTPEYMAYYYAQRHIDPRLPPPLHSHNSWRKANGGRLEGATLPKAPMPQRKHIKSGRAISPPMSPPLSRPTDIDDSKSGPSSARQSPIRTSSISPVPSVGSRSGSSRGSTPSILTTGTTSFAQSVAKELANRAARAQEEAERLQRQALQAAKSLKTIAEVESLMTGMQLNQQAAQQSQLSSSSGPSMMSQMQQQSMGMAGMPPPQMPQMFSAQTPGSYVPPHLMPPAFMQPNFAAGSGSDVLKYQVMMQQLYQQSMLANNYMAAQSNLPFPNQHQHQQQYPSHSHGGHKPSRDGGDGGGSRRRNNNQHNNYSSHNNSNNNSGDHYGHHGGRDRRGEEQRRNVPQPPQWLADMTQRFSLAQVIDSGRLAEVTTHQSGSRFVQQRLKEADPVTLDRLIDTLEPDLLELSKDVFANYVTQKLFEHADAPQRLRLAHLIQGKVMDLSMHIYGCRVVQRALDVSTEEMQKSLVSELRGHVLDCLKDVNGNHVIQRCIVSVPAHVIDFIIRDFLPHAQSLACHPFGCRVIQRLLENLEGETSSLVVANLIQSVEPLSRDQYGNYVIQHVLLHGSQSQKAQVFKALKGNVLRFSCHKFSSNVVEECFTSGSFAQRDSLVDEILGPESLRSPTPVLLGMVKDQYANYVVQKMLQTLNSEQRSRLVRAVKKHLNVFRRLPYGRHVISKIEKLTGKQLVSSQDRTNRQESYPLRDTEGNIVGGLD